MRAKRASRPLTLLTLALLAVACSAEPETAPGPPPTASGPSSEPSAPTAPTPTAPTTTATPAPTPRVGPEDVDIRTAVAAVEHLAGEIGPRPGTTPAYFRAAAWVQRRFEQLGWQVERQRFPTPAGFSWVAPVEAGPSVNVIATRGDVRPGEPWLAVGAHLDTVPRAPGAEDNASGIGVLLAVAEALAERRSRLPVVLVAFGSEEPRGEGDAHHHYGSRAYVASLTPAERRSLRGMISMDRVGVGPAVPVGSPDETALDAPTREVLAAARSADVPTLPETGQRSSDHWSFAREGLPGVRLGSTPYAAYHDETDVPAVVRPAQLERTARVVLAWLR